MKLASDCQQPKFWALFGFLDIIAVVVLVNGRSCNDRSPSGTSAGAAQALRGQWTRYSFHMALRS